MSRDALFHSMATVMAAAFLAPSLAFAQPSDPAVAVSGDDLYCAERKLGSNFYCERPAEPEPEEAAPAPAPAAPTPVDTRPPEVLELEAFQEQLKQSRIVALMSPTEENVTDYMLLQKKVGDLASNFADVFMEVGWQNPEVSAIDEFPVDSRGRLAYKSAQSGHVNSTMKGLSERFGLFYFYSGSCPACHAFGPNLAAFSKMHGVDVMAISMDGAPSMEFEQWAPDNGISRRLGLQGTITPAVILFDTQTELSIPISYGVVSVSELEKRIVILTDEELPTFMGGRNAQ